MKKVILFLFVLVPFLSKSQYKYYRDSSYSQAFNYLAATSSVNNGLFWDDPDASIPIGFEFHLFNDTSDKLYLSESIGLGGVLVMDTVISATTHSTGIMAYGSDIQDRDTSGNGSFSPISYQLGGMAPNRIFKMEWKNAGYYNAIDNGAYTDSVNFQLWLYEGSDIVEMHFGNGNYVSPNIDLYDGGTGTLVALFDSLDNSLNCNKCYFLKDIVTAPSLDSTTNLLASGVPPGMIGNAPPGSVYRFIPKKAGGGSVGYDNFYTSVTNDILFIDESKLLRLDIYSNETFQYTINDMQGNIVKRGMVNKGRTFVDANSFAQGLYVVNLMSANVRHTIKFVR